MPKVTPNYPTLSGPYLDALYQQWRADPKELDGSWQAFFAGFELAAQQTPASAAGQAAVDHLMFVYRSQGHRMAEVDPLGEAPAMLSEFALESFGFVPADLDREFDTGHLAGYPPRLPLREVIAVLRDTYCRSIGVEYLHIQDQGQRRWLQQQMEPCRNRPEVGHEQKARILQQLIDAELFESFTHARYPGQKRFSLEGGETIIPALHRLIDVAGDHGVVEIVLGMAHRGRLSVLANILGMSYEMIFSEFEGNFIADSVQGDGDVKYHKGYSSTYVNLAGRQIHLSLTANPSHLEAVCPVVEGRVRAKQRQHGDSDKRQKVVPLLIHGDAAFAGQGIVAETLNLSQLPGYETGGTVHLIVNNQIGFTTSPTEARSTVYPTDVGKKVEAPIFHVNGDDPEAVTFAVQLALEFRQRFARDVVVDMVCYRRHGHNEGDEPAFTQPVLYRKIRERPSVRRLYTDRLAASGHVTREDSDEIAARFRDVLNTAHRRARRLNPTLEVQAFEKLWRGLDGAFSFDPVDTRVAYPALQRVTEALCRIPEGFNLNRKVARQLPERQQLIAARGEVDWAFAELLAFGSLLAEGTPVRLSGQDSARGTFSQRHAVWQDMDTGAPYKPLAHIAADQALFCVYNSTLSEAAVLGFDYGYAVTEPRMLIMWEAQFGDFANGAQVIIDQFITSAESKWQRDCGLVMLLPHGYEGQGPEHSNAYLERYLIACAENNVQVCYPSSPAQYFHLLRRQVRRPLRLPLVVMTPKSLLRHKRCKSSVEELIDGRFSEFLADGCARSPRRLVICSGKLYYDLAAEREQQAIDDVALMRVEQFHPFNEQLFCDLVEPFRPAEEVIWAQEESANRGGWNFMFPRLLRLFPEQRIGYVGRDASASPATGSLRIHQQEQQAVVRAALSEPLAAVEGTRRLTFKAIGRPETAGELRSISV